MEMTYAIAFAAGTDAGNRHMRGAGRATWNADDFAAAAAEFERLFALVEQPAQPEEVTSAG